MFIIRIEDAVYTDAESLAVAELEAGFENLTSQVSARHIVRAESEAELKDMVRIATTDADLRLNLEVQSAVSYAEKAIAISRAERTRTLASLESAIAEAVYDLDVTCDAFHDAWAELKVSMEEAGVLIEPRETEESAAAG